MSNLKINVGGVWKDVTDVSCKSSGIWSHGSACIKYNSNWNTPFIYNPPTFAYCAPTTKASGVSRSSVQSKFGGYSMLCDGTTNAYLQVPQYSNLQFGSSDFTIEGWVYFQSVGAAWSLWEMWTGGSTYQVFCGGGGSSTHFQSWSGTGGNNCFYYSSPDPTYSIGWHHLCCQRSGTSCYIHVDGVPITLTNHTLFNGSIGTYTAPLQIGTSNRVGNSNCYYDEIRVSKGVARYGSGTFTPPTSAFNTDSYTMLLLHMDDLALSDSSMTWYPQFTDIVPAMTSNGPESGFTISGIYYVGGGEPYQLFDNNAGSTWYTYPSALPANVVIDCGTSKTIYGYTLATYYSDRASKDWTIEGSNTGAFAGEQTIIDTRVGITGWLSQTPRTFMLSSSATFRYFKYNISANNGNGVHTQMTEMELLGYNAASGGIITTDGLYKVHTFNASGTFNTGSINNVDVLVVAGGGGGSGYYYGSGGGAGGMIYKTGQIITPGLYTITVGNGGAGSGLNTNGTSGSNSSFATLIVATGGGGAGAGQNSSGNGNPGLNGGSGGGGGVWRQAAGTGIVGQGNDGGGGGDGGGYAGGGGGGGAGAPGTRGAYSYGAPGKGGNGLQCSITGSAVYYAGGGSAGGGGAGGLGGGGAGTGAAGTPNTGGGGGGYYSASGSGGSGGSGVVIIRYRLPS